MVAAPTNYDSRKNFFDTSAVEAVLDLVMQVNPDAVIVIKSTIPVGYTRHIREKTGNRNILFSRNSCGKARPSTTTFTPAASLWAPIPMTPA